AARCLPGGKRFRMTAGGVRQHNFFLGELAMQRTLAAGVLLLLAGGAARGQDLPAVVVDTHIHLYDTQREGGVPWPSKQSPLYAPHLPADFKRVALPLGVTHAVIVEASPLVSDNQWLLDLVRGDGLFLGVVGRLDVADAAFGEQLAALARDPRYVGIRVPPKEAVRMDDRQTAANLQTLAEHGLTLDLVIGGVPLDEITALAKAYPKLRIVIDHALGKRSDGQAVDAAWQEQVQRLAACPNVYCKLSGMLEQSAGETASRDAAYYRPVLDVLWKEFGDRRLMYASNWPVVNQRGDYQANLAIVKAFLKDKPAESRQRCWGQNAIEIYRLGERVR
ncbi:MAG: amidohydrolase family protein, partial [Planctomycetales bacterium]|nr:amidohydrolase family protein [Planctomycetales bacterium]